MIDDDVLEAIARAHRENRNAEKRLQELVGDFITRTHTVADVIKLMDMVAWRAEAGEAGQVRERVKYARELVTKVLRTWDQTDTTSAWTTLGRVEALLLNEEER